MSTIETRVGLIVDGDNRFFGRSTFDDWIGRITSVSDGLLVALGVSEPGDAAREALRLATVCLMSPDARVWPLKLTRLLASYGDANAGHFGAQLVTAGKTMGPGSIGSAAAFLAWISAEQERGATLADAIAAWRATHEGAAIGGFGVPFRAVDERRAALLTFVGDGPLSAGRSWRLHLEVIPALEPLRPNIALGIAALLLDSGVPVDRVGIAGALLMAHVFAAHAIEAATNDGDRLHALPPSMVAYKGTPARTIGDGAAAAVPPALQRAT